MNIVLLKKIVINLFFNFKGVLLMAVINNNFNISSHLIKVKIDKSIFEFDLFWSVRDGSLVDIDTLINIYSQYSNTKNMKALVSKFGKNRVIRIMKANKKSNSVIAYNNNMSIINDTSTKIFTSKDLMPFEI